ncbi:MAG: methyltransferase domain-containing protein [Phycisphaerales bacterium]|nr:MAG: methyltransferase domain-containing protein [Phycisphaerales bacterium]
MAAFFGLGAVPVFCNVLGNSRAEALTALRAPIDLAYCAGCGLVCNLAFDPQLVQYSPSYENSLRFSSRFQEYEQHTSRRLVREYQLYGKDIVEVGCGDGDFLNMLCELGANRGIGLDPSHDPETAAAVSRSQSVRIVPEALSAAHSEYQADFVCCRHVLEHVERPLDFLKSIRATIGARSGCVVYFEVPNVLYTLRDMGVWDIIYEHCSYFTPKSLAHVFERAGFGVIAVAEQYEGQFVAIEASVARPRGRASSSCPSTDDGIDELVARFCYVYREKVALWKERLSRLLEQGRKVVLWGAGSKGVTFLNVLDVGCEQVEYVIDVNPRKQGKFVACTGQSVVAPEFLREYRPDNVVIMNPIYLQEIRKALAAFALSSEVVVA